MSRIYPVGYQKDDKERCDDDDEVSQPHLGFFVWTGMLVIPNYCEALIVLSFYDEQKSIDRGAQSRGGFMSLRHPS